MNYFIILIVIVSGCAFVGNKQTTVFDDIREIENTETSILLQRAQTKTKKPHPVNPMAMVFGSKNTITKEEKTEPEQKTYTIELFSEALPLNDFIQILLAETGYSFSALLDVPPVYVSLSGSFDKEEILEIIQRVCNQAGYKFIVSQNICTLQKSTEGTISGLSVISYTFHYITPSHAMENGKDHRFLYALCIGEQNHLHRHPLRDRTFC